MIICSLPEIDGLSKETVLNSWLTKFDTIFRGEEDMGRGTIRCVHRHITYLCTCSGGRGRGGAPQANADVILGRDQLYDMFQQILGVKKFEHQLIFNALQVGVNSEVNLFCTNSVGQRRRTGGRDPTRN
jgi:hypothetical protein